PNPVPIAPNEISLRVPRTQERRPDQHYSDVRIVSNLAESWYHAAQLEWETGEYHGFAGRASYTFGKALDTGSEATDVGGGEGLSGVTSFPPRDGREAYAKGYSRFDVRHRFVLSSSYRFPWLLDRNDWMGSAFGGWTLSTIFRFASGTPFTPLDTGAPDILFVGTN